MGSRVLLLSYIFHIYPHLLLPLRFHNTGVGFVVVVVVRGGGGGDGSVRENFLPVLDTWAYSSIALFKINTEH